MPLFSPGLQPQSIKKGGGRIRSLELERKYGIAGTSHWKDCMTD